MPVVYMICENPKYTYLPRGIYNPLGILGAVFPVNTWVLCLLPVNTGPEERRGRDWQCLVTIRNQ